MDRLFAFLKTLLAMLLLASAPQLCAQAAGASDSIQLNATVQEGLGLALSSHAVNFNLLAGSAVNPGDRIVTATTAWNSKPGRDVRLYAFFNSAPAALSNGAGSSIPSGNFQIGVNGGPLLTTNGTMPVGGAGAGVQLFTLKVTGLNKTGARTDALNFNINLATLPQLPAGTYTGTLYIQARVF